MDLNELKDKLLSALGQAGEGAKDFAGKAADATRGFAEKAADKAKSGARIAKLNIEIAQEKENMKKAYLEIGKLYYDTHKDDPDGFFIQLCEEVAAAEQAIAAKESEIADLKDSKDDPDVDVEFEEIVEQEEAAVERCCGETVEECCEDAAQCCGETVEDCCEAAADAAQCCCDKVEDAAEDCISAVEKEFRTLETEFNAIEQDLKGAADEIVEKLGEVVE